MARRKSRVFSLAVVASNIALGALLACGSSTEDETSDVPQDSSDSGAARDLDAATTADDRTVADAIEESVLADSGVGCGIEASTDTGPPPTYVKASNTRTPSGSYTSGSGGNFGASAALSADGTSLVVGAQYESSLAKGVNGDQFASTLGGLGAAYAFTFADGGWSQTAYIKASNTARVDFGSSISSPHFGASLALSGDGETLSVGAPLERSAATGIDGDQADLSLDGAGAVYVFARGGGSWSQEAYVKASNTREGSQFGSSIALSSDGNTMVVGAPREASGSSGVGADESDTSAPYAGAAYVFARSSGVWHQEAFIKASNARASAFFAFSVALSGDGNLLAIGAPGDTSSATGIDGNQADTSATSAGAVYLFRRVGATWSQVAYVKASNTRASAQFGFGVALARDGQTLAVGANGESSASRGINGDQTDTSAPGAGAVYVFVPSSSTWTQQAYVKASNARKPSSLGYRVELSSDGNVLAVVAPTEPSASSGLNGNQCDSSMMNAGAAYTFARSAGTWTQTAYVKASNPHPFADFGTALALSGAGAVLAVGAYGERSSAIGINGNQWNTSAPGAGAVYVYGNP